MNTYTLKKGGQMGDRDEKYGASYWFEVEEQFQPVMFNLMQGSAQVGDKVSSDEVLLKTSSKGTQYHRLKKVTVQEGSPRFVEPKQESDLEARVRRLEEKVFGEPEDRNDDSARFEGQNKDEVVDFDENEDPSLDSIPF